MPDDTARYTHSTGVATGVNELELYDAVATGTDETSDRIPGEFIGIPGAMTQTALYLPSTLSYEQWARTGAILRYLERGVQWWLGDWWRFGERAYGEMASQEAQDNVYEMTGRAYKTVANAAWVASRIETSRRRESLSWSHHAEVASIDDPAEQDAWLDRAEAEGWTRAELRQALHGEADVVELESGDGEVCEHCGRRVIVQGGDLQ